MTAEMLSTFHGKHGLKPLAHNAVLRVSILTATFGKIAEGLRRPKMQICILPYGGRSNLAARGASTAWDPTRRIFLACEIHPFDWDFKHAPRRR